MSNTPPDLPGPAKRRSPALIGGGVLVVALGFGLPLLVTPGSAPDPVAREAAGAREPAGPLAPPAPMPAPDATGIGASLLKLVVGLVVVCGLCVVVARVVGPPAPSAPGAMDVLASIAVSQCVIHLVRAGGRRLLVGTDPGGVKAMLELPGPEPEVPPAFGTEPAAANAPADTGPEPLVTQHVLTQPVPAAPAVPATQEEILNLLLRLRSRADASPPA
ncbi:flagellar biosynthetic protein FliO [Frigoriglobus tundricola]|uniref:Flagellar biosynthesis protein FliO n=1 Tax=Frigoriglobus tundricola TaxID=2774151 RepID=A0A6M5YKB8_9BACT|nr:flagellar biosynthetic protein FliO [Frigoriglobus tundricola]QJW94405.1 hypothetical protein FTUN_1925 [Frigoriglobus tundricola]